MATTKDPESVLDRVARDLSRTLLHGSRPADTAGNVLPATIATAQQIRVDLPAAGPMNFNFALGGSSLTVPVDHDNASHTQSFMTAAVGADRKKYLSVSVDPNVPNWVFQQRQFTIANPPVAEDSISTTIPDLSAPPAASPATIALTAVRLPGKALTEVADDDGDSYVSLSSLDANQKLTPIPAANWLPALILRFPLKKSAPPAGFPAGMQVYEVGGTPEGDRWFLDRLGLLPGTPGVTPPVIADISLTLERKDSASGVLVRVPLSDWSIARTNLTREARSAPAMDLSMAPLPPAPVFPYIAVAGVGPDQDKDAIRLLQMASITNSGGYFLRATTAETGAQNLILTVVLGQTPDTVTGANESALLPRSANSVALRNDAKPDAVAFNGLSHIEVTPYTPPGTVSFGWTRVVPSPDVSSPPVPDEDKFGFGTISMVDYSAADASGLPVNPAGAIPVISPMDSLPGDHFARKTPAAAPGQPGPVPKSAAMRLRAPHRMRAAVPAADPDTVVHYYRATLVCYDKTTESPWERLSDPNRRSIAITPGFRDVFGNRFVVPAPAPVFQHRLFYTDAMISPGEWPGVRFAIYPGVQNAGMPNETPVLSIEFSYDPTGASPQRTQRLKDICTQLNGVDGDVAITLLASPLVKNPMTLDCATIVKQLQAWNSSDMTNRVVVLKTVACDGAVAALQQFEPQLVVARTKPDYLPQPGDLPDNGDLAALITTQVASVTALVNMQVNATPPPASPPAPERQDEFRAVAQQFRKFIGVPLNLRVGFLRDHQNQHELWLIPNSFFPTAPADPVASAAWSFATPCPMSNGLGNDSFPVPNFATTTTTDPAWQTFPLVNAAVVDQDFDQLGRIALRMLETETADLGILMLPANAAVMRSLLTARETIANQLGQFQGSGFLVPLFADAAPGDLDGAAISRIARDAFLGDLNSFYAVSTAIQLPLATRGSTDILTFQGQVGKPTFVGGDPSKPPIFSDILLGGGDPKVTILYDLPPGVTDSSTIPAIASLPVNITHVQLPMPGVTGPANTFSQGPWIELAPLGTEPPLTLIWTGYPEPIPVALRVFPSKPVIQSTDVTTAFTRAGGTVSLPPKIDATTAPLLAQWGWEIALGLIEANTDDTVHVAVRYPDVQPPAAKAAALAADWAPRSLLHSLFAMKLLNDNRNSAALLPVRLSILSLLTDFLSGFVAQGPVPAPPSASVAGPAQPASDTFTLSYRAASTANDIRQVIRGPIGIQWSIAVPPNTLSTATLTAPPEASLTGAAPVRSYRVGLTLLRNELFGKVKPRPANQHLIYQCAPVESARDCLARTTWAATAPAEALVFDMTGHNLETALQTFFAGIFHQQDVSSVVFEVGMSLAWTKGNLKIATPFSILPSDLPPLSKTSDSVAAFVLDKCRVLLGPETKAPQEADAAAIRLRIKIGLPGDPRAFLEIAAIDFALTNQGSNQNMPEQLDEQPPKQFDKQLLLKGHEGEFANALLDLVRGIVDRSSEPTSRLFPNGVGLIDLNASIEPRKISLSLRISDAAGAAGPGVFSVAPLPPARGVADDVLSYCVSLDTADDPVMKDCNAFAKNVGAHFGVTIPDLNADGIVDSFGAAPFTKTTMDPTEAMTWAATGLVVAGMKLSELNPAYGTKYDNGHVAIVHSTEDTVHKGFPMASWGRLGSRGQSNTTIRLSFPAQACDDRAVHFAFAPTS